jgi:hypothetical protein
MSWIDPNEYDANDDCPICYENLGVTKGIYKTSCGHIFHNNCLLDYCESRNGEIECPICRSNLEYECMNVWAFKHMSLDASTAFNGNQHVLDIYNNQNAAGIRKRKNKRTKKTKKYTKRTRKSRK